MAIGPPRVVGEAEAPQLAPHGGDVGLGRDPRVLARLHGVLLGGQTEGVVAHGVQHVVARHPQVAGVDVGADVAERVADVQPHAGRIGEHVEHVALGPISDPVEPLGQWARGVRCQERAFPLPTVLPVGFDLVGERGGVAVRRDVIGAGGLLAHGRQR